MINIYTGRVHFERDARKGGGGARDMCRAGKTQTAAQILKSTPCGGFIPGTDFLRNFLTASASTILPRNSFSFDDDDDLQVSLILMLGLFYFSISSLLPVIGLFFFSILGLFDYCARSLLLFHLRIIATCRIRLTLSSCSYVLRTKLSDT
jgi:hypothetical protein